MEETGLVVFCVPLVCLDFWSFDGEVGVVSHILDCSEDQEAGGHLSLLGPAETHRNAGLVFLHRNARHDSLLFGGVDGQLRLPQPRIVRPVLDGLYYGHVGVEEHNLLGRVGEGDLL